MALEETECDLCGAREARLKHRVDGFHIVRCVRCDLTYVAEKVEPAFLKQYYGQAYYTGAQPKGYADYIGQRESRKRHFRSLIPSIQRHLTGSCPRVVDVGCAAGFFLEVVRERGWNGLGVEVSGFAAEYARSRLGLDVIVGTLAEAALPEASVDLVTLWDVVEHLPSPRDVLGEARRVLRPGGMLCVSTGDISGFTARFYGARWSLLAPPGHLFYFSRRTLFALLRQSGFEVLQWQSDGAFLLNGGGVVPEANGTAGRLPAVVVGLHHNRWINALLRRLRLGSIITVYARRCGA
jgi:SAM-dependent methyltransferase